jgi:hypothetical protein
MRGPVLIDGWFDKNPVVQFAANNVPNWGTMYERLHSPINRNGRE